MHRFLKAAGFADLDEERVHRLIWSEVIRPERISAKLDLKEDTFILEYRLPVNEHVGIAAAVLYAEDYNELSYYYPYFNTYEITSDGPLSLERHTMTETYSGVIDDFDTGISLIFFVNNPLSYRERPDTAELNGVALAAFANEGIVILPVIKEEGIKGPEGFIGSAGEEDIDILTAQEIANFRLVADRMETEDLYSVVEQSLIPCGVECDIYSVIGEILDVAESANLLTGEKLWFLRISSNDIVFWLCMRQADLTGEPAAGRRIKCRLWMQANVNVCIS